MIHWACDQKYINTIIRIGKFLFLTKTDSFTHCSRRLLNPHDLSYVHEDRLVCRIFAWNSSSSKFPISRETWLQLIICSYQFRFRNSREASIRKQINFLKFVRRNYCQQILFKFCCRSTHHDSSSYSSRIKSQNSLTFLDHEKTILSWARKISSILLFIYERTSISRWSPLFVRRNLDSNFVSECRAGWLNIKVTVRTTREGEFRFPVWMFIAILHLFDIALSLPESGRAPRRVSSFEWSRQM